MMLTKVWINVIIKVMNITSVPFPFGRVENMNNYRHSQCISITRLDFTAENYEILINKKNHRFLSTIKMCVAGVSLLFIRGAARCASEKNIFQDLT